MHIFHGQWLLFCSNGTTPSIPESTDTPAGLKGPQGETRASPPRDTPSSPFLTQSVSYEGKRLQSRQSLCSKSAPLGQRPGALQMQGDSPRVRLLQVSAPWEREAGGPGAVTVMAGTTSEKWQAHAEVLGGAPSEPRRGQTSRSPRSSPP